MAQTIQSILNQEGQDRLAARSVADPNKILYGASVGATPGNQGLPSTSIVQQARTSNPTTVSTGRYNLDGTLNTIPVTSGAPSSGNPASSPSTGIPGLSAASVLTPEEYKAKYGPKGVDEAAIREEVRQQNQARIDAMNGIYDRMVREQAVVNTGNEGATRAINARSGLLGSDFGNANDANQKAAGQNAIRGINEERGLKISNIFAEIDKMAFDRVAAKKAEALGDANSYNIYLEKAQQSAKESAKALGASGVGFDELKEKAPDQLQKLLESSGYSEMELALQMNAAKKTAEKIDWKTDIKGNHVIVYGVNPTTGQVEYHSQELPAEAAGNDVKVVDGELWSVSSDGKSATMIGGPGGKGKESDFKYVPATKYQSAGYFNSSTGEFKPLTGGQSRFIGGGDGGGTGVPTVPVDPSMPPVKSFDEYLAEQEDKAGMTFGPAKREFLRKQFNEQEVAQKASIISSASPADADISKFDPTVQLIILGKQKMPEASSKEYSRIKAQLLQATKLGLLDNEGKQTDTSKATADQYNAATYAERMAQAENVFGQTADTIKGSSFMSQAAGLSSSVPGALKNSTYQQQEQAERNFVTALLRKESGAAISDTEFSGARKQYFPQAGDSDKTLAQKKENRRIAIEGMRRSAGSVDMNTSTSPVGTNDFRSKYSY